MKRVNLTNNMDNANHKNPSNNSVNFTVVWCNGSTKDFGSFSTGSSPVTTII